MRCYLIVILTAAVALCGAASAAPYGPLVAGTAAGQGGLLAKSYALGVHYPFGASEPKGYPAMNGCQPSVNRTAPYDEWPDPARVAGRRPAMTAEIWIITSKRRSEPENDQPSHYLMSYVTHRGHEVAATAPPSD